MLLILAGDYSQAVRYARHHNIQPSKWRYVRRSSDLRGYQGAEAVVVGTFHQRNRNEVRDILDTITYENMNVQWIEDR